MQVWPLPSITAFDPSMDYKRRSPAYWARLPWSVE